MTRIQYLFFAISLLVLQTAIASAQTPQAAAPQPGDTIERIEVSGNTSVASETIRVYLGLAPGQPYRPDEIQQNFMNLWQTGLFDDVRVEAVRSAEGGAVIQVTVSERPRIGAVEYRGNKELTAAKIQEALDAARIDVHIGSTVEQTLIRRAAEAIRNAYAEGGFEGVSVEPRLEEMISPNERRVVFEINEGIKARIARIRFVGNERFNDRRLRRTMKEVRPTNLYTRLRKRDLYVPSKLEEELENVRNLYQDHGYKDVAIGEVRVQTTEGRKPRVILEIPVTEGDIHTFGGVSIEGNSVFEDEMIIGRWPLTEGDTLSRKPIQDRIEFFEELYRRRGYIYAYINPEYIERDENVVDVKVNVYEGEQFRLGRLEFEGNTATRDKVLRREIFIHEGDIMDMETFKASLYKLGQLGYFKVTENPDFRVNPESKTVDVTIRGQEEGRNEVQFGGGYSETYGFFGQFQFSTRNLLGTGTGVGLAYQKGRNQDFFSFNYSDPWFLDRPQSFGVSLFKRATNYPESVGYDVDGVGGSLAYGFRTGRFQSVSFLYSYEDREEIFNLSGQQPDDQGNVPLPQLSDYSFSTSAFIPSYRYDSRDNPFDTFRGTRGSLSVAYAGGPLGGTLNFVKPVGTFSRYFPLTRRSALSFNVEAGVIVPLENESGCVQEPKDQVEMRSPLCVPLSERFRVGGESSVRGFQFSSIGPRGVIPGAGTNAFLGGHKYNVFNFEYVYRVNDPLRFVLFADAGNAYGRRDEWDVTDLRYSTGAELRVYLPVFQFPLRFIYALNPDEREGDRFETFQFSVGNTF